MYLNHKPGSSVTWHGCSVAFTCDVTTNYFVCASFCERHRECGTYFPIVLSHRHSASCFFHYLLEFFVIVPCPLCVKISARIHYVANLLHQRHGGWSLRGSSTWVINIPHIASLDKKHGTEVAGGKRRISYRDETQMQPPLASLFTRCVFSISGNITSSGKN